MTIKNAKIPHFFKIILSDTLSEEKLGIPRMFVKRFGKYLSDNVFLKVPSGSKWPVELVRNGDHVYFGNGWHQFAEYHSLAHGSFLVFRFEDFPTCCLSVMIFDKSASEIDYPENTGSDVSSRPCKKMKPHDCSGQSQANSRSVKRKQPLADKEKGSAVKRAITCFKPNNPFFSITMHPTYVSKRYRVTIPVISANKYFRKQRGDITLNSADGKTWSVQYGSYKTSCATRLTMISRGWKKFARDNHLAVGDVCFFELINGHPNEFKVGICRKDQDAQTILSTGNNKGSNVGDSKKLNTVNPYFKVSLTKSHLQKPFLNKPAKFMEKCNKNVEKAMLQVENRCGL